MKESDLKDSSDSTMGSDPYETKYFWPGLETCSILNCNFSDSMLCFFLPYIFSVFFYFAPRKALEEIEQSERFDKVGQLLKYNDLDFYNSFMSHIYCLFKESRKFCSLLNDET